MYYKYNIAWSFYCIFLNYCNFYNFAVDDVLSLSVETIKIKYSPIPIFYQIIFIVLQTVYIALVIDQIGTAPVGMLFKILILNGV